jgi:hypothetical protein
MTQTISGRTTPEEACEALGIKKSPYYERLRFLGIKANKDDEGTYLNAEQMRMMWDLNEHILRTGKMEGFQGGGQLALSENSGLALEIPEQPDIPGIEEDENRLEELIREAAELKVQQMAMPELVKLHLAAGMTEDDLPADLKAKLQAVREAANPASPKRNPAAAASKLLAKYRATRSGGN